MSSALEYLYYADRPDSKYNCYNGNIGTMKWSNSNYDQIRGYKFVYDNANRLTDALYGERASLDNKENRYNEVLEYDENGNITSLQRRGLKQDGQYGKIDNLNLSYNGNQLFSVEEDAKDNIHTGTFEYKKLNGSGYKYNENGSLIADKSRGIAYIKYDYNNNPTLIVFTNGSETEYVYSASGQKLRVIHITAKPNVVTREFGKEVKDRLSGAYWINYEVTDYLLGGSLVMKNGKIDKVLFDGGYAQASVATKTTDKFAFNFYNQDHLGNNREVVNAKGIVQQVTNYYPFGAPYADATASKGATVQPYKYNGKELDLMHGLNTYDYGARQSDPVLGRWDRIDPLCEKYYSTSPYAYCANNPVKFIDPDGRSVEADSLSQGNIINTLTPEEAEYIQFDDNGVLNTDLMNQCTSTSDNFISIKQLAMSDQNYVFKVTDKDHRGRAFFDNSESGGLYYRGITEMPGASSSPSPDNNVYILVGNCLSSQQQAMTTAHEAYGHGYLYDTTRSIEAASHTYGNTVIMEWDDELKMQCPVSIKIETNHTLTNRLNIVVNQAKSNYGKR